MEPDSTRPFVDRSNYLKMDDQGRIIPPTEAEQAEMSVRFHKALEAMAAIPDNPNEPDELFWRAMDESRPDAPLFRELYEP